MAPIATWGISMTALYNFGYLKGFEGVFIYRTIGYHYCHLVLHTN